MGKSLKPDLKSRPYKPTKGPPSRNEHTIFIRVGRIMGLGKENEERGSNLLERVACLITNKFMLLPAVSQGGYWATGNGIPVYDQTPLDSNTLWTL